MRQNIKLKQTFHSDVSHLHKFSPVSSRTRPTGSQILRLYRYDDKSFLLINLEVKVLKRAFQTEEVSELCSVVSLARYSVEGSFNRTQEELTYESTQAEPLNE